MDVIITAAVIMQETAVAATAVMTVQEAVMTAANVITTADNAGGYTQTERGHRGVLFLLFVLCKI